MTIFGAAITAIFSDPNMSEAADYRSGGADPATTVRVIKVAPDTVQEFNAGRFVRETIFLDVRVSEVALPARGDTFTIGEAIFEVLGDPARDTERLVWKVEARERDAV
ncbi:MAG: hypothetical protein GYB50_03950 [Rhodobacteraceae bacterium]|nr:hypothetical protein [Paracoccaceae bacterium]